MADASPWRGARRLLCVRLDSLGDVLMTGPAFRALRESEAGREVVLLTSPSGAEVARLMPGIDDVILYEAPWMKATPPRRDSAVDFEMVEALRHEEFDAAVIFTAYSQSPLPAAMLCYLAGLPLRLAHCHENPYQLLTDWVPDPEPARFIRHEVQRQLDLVAEVGATASDTRLALDVPAEAEASVARTLGEDGLSSGDYVVVHPGATAPSRRYPPELFAEVVARLEREGVRVVAAGSGGEQSLVREVLSRSKAAVNLAGRLTLDELAALLEGARLLVANNSGPVHVAAAVGTPVVDLYALTNPQHAPWGVPSRVLSNDVPCRWCYKSVCPEGHHLCLRGVSPESVVGAALELLGAPVSPRR